MVSGSDGSSPGLLVSGSDCSSPGLLVSGSDGSSPGLLVSGSDGCSPGLLVSASVGCSPGLFQGQSKAVSNQVHWATSWHIVPCPSNSKKFFLCHTALPSLLRTLMFHTAPSIAMHFIILYRFTKILNIKLLVRLVFVF